MMSKFRSTAFITSMNLILVLILISCSVLSLEAPIAPISEDQSPGNATSPKMPDFLVFVNPTESITMDKYEELRRANCYPCGVTVGILWDRTKPLNGLNGLLSRISLLIDEKDQSNLAVSVSDGLLPFGPYYVGWTPRLLPGLHEATLNFITDSGEVVAYTWRFVVTEK